MSESESLEVTCLKKQALRGNADAQFHLGSKYIVGDGVEYNINIGIMWLERSSENSNVHAACGLGILYEFGDGGIEIDIEEAKKHYQRAASLGYSYAAWRYGQLLSKYGEDGSEEAQKYILKAAEQGVIEAQHHMAKIALLKEDYETAINWFQNLTDFRMRKASGLTRMKNVYSIIGESLNEIAIMYREGLGVKKNPKEAFLCFQRGARLYNDPFCCYNYARHLEFGDVTRQNKAAASKFYRIAADQGDEDAKRALESLRALGVKESDDSELTENVDNVKSVSFELEGDSSTSKPTSISQSIIQYFARSKIENDIDCDTESDIQVAKKGKSKTLRRAFSQVSF